MTRRLITIGAVIGTALMLAIPAAWGTGIHNNPGQVASRLGSPDPREGTLNSGMLAGLIPSVLGSPDPRDTAQASRERR